MHAWKSLFLSLVLSAILSVGVSYLLAPSFTPPSSDGSLGQSPLLYILIVLLILIIGGVLHFIFRPSEGKSFHFWLFVCVAFSGLMIGGIIHELVHVVLISHPTQLRFHFGDSSSILSTCCLNPGEYDYELLAYGIQFLVTGGWLLVFREFFVRDARTIPSPAQDVKTLPSVHLEEEKKYDSLVPASEDPEWAAMHKQTQALLDHRGRDDDSTSELPDLHHLKVPKRE
jgi:hypothetical protein